MTKICLIKPGIMASAGKEFLVRAFFQYRSFFQDDYPVGKTHRGKPMGDYDGGSANHHRFKAFLYLRLGKRVDAGRCLVQDENRRILQEYAGKRYELSLSHAHGRTPVAGLRGKPVRQIVHPVAPSQGSGRFFHVGVAGSRFRIPDILKHRPGKKKRILRNEPYGCP